MHFGKRFQLILAFSIWNMNFWLVIHANFHIQATKSASKNIQFSPLPQIYFKIISYNPPVPENKGGFFWGTNTFLSESKRSMCWLKISTKKYLRGYFPTLFFLYEATPARFLCRGCFTLSALLFFFPFLRRCRGMSFMSKASSDLRSRRL